MTTPPGRPHCLLVRAILMVLAVALFGGVAAGQVVTGAAPVTAEAKFFGVGGQARPGEWAGIQLELTDAGSGRPARRVLVQVHMRDVDGDTCIAQRDTTLTVGVPRSIWVYVRLSATVGRTTDFTVSVRELDENDTVDVATVGELLLAKRIQPGGMVDAHVPMIGIVGRDDVALSQYRLEDRSGGTVPTWHEAYAIVGSIEPRSMPDRWMGLAQFEALVWTAGDPFDLTEGRDEALMEWVRRGGHLVIVPPVVGDPWFAARNPIGAIMPIVDVTRLEGRSYEPYRNLLTVPQVSIGNTMPSAAVVYSFSPQAGAGVSDAIPLFTSAADGCIAVRRVVGTGMVTVVGLDVRHRGLTATGLLSAEALWHPILGKRFEIFTAEEQLRMQGRLSTTRFAGSGSVDAWIGPDIAKGAAAGVGVLLALIVFGAYWLLAGPGGFGLLKAKGWVHHSWVAFVATVAAFAAVAWTGARAISPSRFEGEHLTFVDQVYGQGVQRARTYVSALLPIYGDATLLAGQPGLDAGATQALAPWAERDAGTLLSFPDSRAYAWDVTHAERITVPARSTIKQLVVDWLGGPRAMDGAGGDARWGNIRPVGDEAPRVVGGAEPLAGRLAHSMSEPLQNVQIVYVAGLLSEATVMQNTLTNRGDRLRCEGSVWAFDNPWMPGEASAIDLSTLRAPGAGLEDFFERQAPRGALGGIPGTTTVSDAETFLTWFGAAAPPEYRRDTASRTILTRTDGHGLDLSKWLTQPCLIVTGEVNTETARVMGAPTPMMYGNAENPRLLPMSGRTMVRWIYPLPARPVRLEGTKATPEQVDAMMAPAEAAAPAPRRPQPTIR